MAKTALVTGASRGIGKAIAIALAAKGYDVAIAARTLRATDPTPEHSQSIHKHDLRPLPGSIEETAAEIESLGRTALPLRMDLTDRTSVEAATTALLDVWGGVDAVVHNGRHIGPGLMDSLLDTPIDQFPLFLEAHGVAPIRITQMLLPAMLQRGGGTFLTTSSVAATQWYPQGPLPGLGYRIGKAAGHTLTGSLLAEYGDRGIRAFNMDPGFTLTERNSLDVEEFGFDPRMAAPPAAIAAVAAWLLTSPDADALLGTDITAQSLALERGLYPDWRPKVEGDEVNAGLLRGIRIVDLSDGIAGPTATMVLAEAGADVVLVEPPGGNASRSLPGFRTWNRSKQSVVADLERPEGRERVQQLLAGADVLVHSYGPTQAAALGLDDATLAAAHPTLIVCSVLAWPVNHPAADSPVDDLLTLARLGVLHEQQGRSDGPIYVRFPLGSWGAVWLAAIGIMARLVSRGRTGVAGPAHTSLAQGALVPMMMHWSRAEAPSPALAVGMPKDRMNASLFECGDGEWIHIMPPAPDRTPYMLAAFAAMGAEAVAAANADDIVGWAAYPNFGANRAAFRTRPAHEWLQHFWEHDIPAQRAMPVGEILTDEQARANRYVIELDDPTTGRIAVPGQPMTLDPPAAVRGPAPAPGQHQDSAGRDWSPIVAPAPVAFAAASASPQRWPLQGLKVLDFGNFLAGPLGPMLLADLGADVVKVEATTGDPMRWADWPFAGCQRGKRAIALDLKSPAARPVLDALVKWADVVHHNLRMPAARKLGLDAAALRAINPDIVFCHASSYGPAGPRADWPGYDQLFQASCGWERAGAGEGNPPMWHRFGFMDHQCAMSSVVATLAAVLEHDRTGRATDVAASLLGAGVLTTSETYLLPDGTLAPMPVLDHEQRSTAPGVRVLRCADGWIAVAARGDQQVAALCRAAGCAGTDDLSDAAAAIDVDALLGALALADVPAERVRLDNKLPFFDDPANRAAGLVAEYRHLDWGRFEQPGAMWHFGNLGPRLDKAPPVLGQHTVEVLREVGLAQPEIDALLAAGAVIDAGRA